MGPIFRSPQHFLDTGPTYLSATRTELSSCPVVMVTSTMIGGKWNHKSRIYSRGGKKKVRTLRQPRGRSNAAAHLDLSAAIKYKLTQSCVNGVFANVTGVFAMAAARSRSGGATSTSAASLRSAARMLQVGRLQLTRKPASRDIPARASTCSTRTSTHARTRQQVGSRSASQTTPLIGYWSAPWRHRCAETISV